MAHDIEIRFRCIGLFEIVNMSLTEICKQESVGISTLSDWKNDDRKEYGGIWLKGCKAKDIELTVQKLREDLQATSIYDDIKKKVMKFNGVTDNGSIVVDGMLDVGSDNKEIQARVEADLLLLNAIGADYFDLQLFKNSMLSSRLLLKPFSIFGYMSLRSYFNLKYKSNFNITKI